MWIIQSAGKIMKKTNKLDKYSIIIFQIENLQMNLFWALLTQFLPLQSPFKIYRISSNTLHALCGNRLQ